MEQIKEILFSSICLQLRDTTAATVTVRNLQDHIVALSDVRGLRVRPVLSNVYTLNVKKTLNMSTKNTLYTARMLGIIITGVGSGGYAGDLTPQLFMWRGY